MPPKGAVSKPKAAKKPKAKKDVSLPACVPSCVAFSDTSSN